MKRPATFRLHIRVAGPTIEHMFMPLTCTFEAGREGFEPPATGFGDQRSDQTELPP